MIAAPLLSGREVCDPFGAARRYVSRHGPASAPDRLGRIATASMTGEAPEPAAHDASAGGGTAPDAQIATGTGRTNLWINLWMDGERHDLCREYPEVLHGLGAPAALERAARRVRRPERIFHLFSGGYRRDDSAVPRAGSTVKPPVAKTLGRASTRLWIRTAA